MRLSKSYLPLMLAAAVTLGSSGCDVPSAASPRPEAPAVSPGAPATSSEAVDRVKAGAPQRKTLELYTSQPGRIEAYEVTPLFSKVTGYVQEVTVDIGDTVKKAQTLVQLSIPEMQDQLEQKQALVAQALAEVKQAEAAARVSAAAVQTARAGVRQAEAGTLRAQGELDRWNAEYERIKALAAKGSVNQKLVDETLNQLRATEASQQEVSASIDSAKARLDEAEAKALMAEADRTAAQAKHRVAEADLRYTTTLNQYSEIKAPYDGVVTHRGIHTGHYVHPANSPAAEPLLVVARTDKLRIVVDIPEMEASFIDAGENGDPATIRCQTQQPGDCAAQVSRTGWSLNTANRSLRTEIDLPNPEDSSLRPGMYATTTILLAKREDALVLPIGAILQEGGKSYCWRVVSGKTDRREIELGLRSGGDVEVLSGLDGSETVVLAGVNGLRQDQSVAVIGAKP